MLHALGDLLPLVVKADTDIKKRKKDLFISGTSKQENKIRSNPSPSWRILRHFQT